MRDTLSLQGINDLAFNAMLEDDYQSFIEQRVITISQLMSNAGNFADMNNAREEE